MTHKSYSLFVVVLFLILFTTGCGSLGTNAVPIQKAQPEPTNTEVVETAIPTETPTPKPPTATPTPEAVLLSSLDLESVLISAWGFASRLRERSGARHCSQDVR